MSDKVDFAALTALLEEDRSIRRFRQYERVDRVILDSLIGLTRYCASGRNAQPLRYRPVFDECECAKVFCHLKWAGYYQDWDGPEEGQRPSAYLIQCLDKRLGNDCMCDDGLHLQAITLGARTLGIGGCIIKSFNPSEISSVLGISDRYRLLHVLALGYPAETPKTVDMAPEGDFKYFREGNDGDWVQVVPKRTLAELILE